MSFKRASRNLERSFLLISSIVLALLFYRLYTVIKKDLEEVAPRLQAGTMINLNADKREERFRALLERGYYFTDKRDSDLAAATMARGFASGDLHIDNIGELNKRRFNVNIEDAFNLGGESYKKRVQVARMLVGFSGNDSIRYQQEKYSPPALPAFINIGLGKYNIDGVIRGPDEKPVAGTLVKLAMILPSDSL